MKIALLLLLLIVAWVLVIPALLKWLWNMTIPELFGLKELRYWQAFRLIIITSLLTGGGSLINFTSNNKFDKNISKLSAPEIGTEEPFAQNKDNNVISLPPEDNTTENK